jgi:hypothetical protein
MRPRPLAYSTLLRCGSEIPILVTVYDESPTHYEVERYGSTRMERLLRPPWERVSPEERDPPPPEPGPTEEQVEAHLKRLRGFLVP